MGMARDGSYGVATVAWRRLVRDGQVFLHEEWGTEPDGGVIYGPLPDEAAATEIIKERAAGLKASFLAARQATIDQYGSLEGLKEQ